MTDDQNAELDAALEAVIAAARAHLAAVKAADGRIDDDEVWQAYVELNNASFDYDELLLDAYGEVTPWDVDAIDPDGDDRKPLQLHCTVLRITVPEQCERRCMLGTVLHDLCTTAEHDPAKA